MQVLHIALDGNRWTCATTSKSALRACKFDERRRRERRRTIHPLLDFADWVPSYPLANSPPWLTLSTQVFPSFPLCRPSWLAVLPPSLPPRPDINPFTTVSSSHGALAFPFFSTSSPSLRWHTHSRPGQPLRPAPSSKERFLIDRSKHAGGYCGCDITRVRGCFIRITRARAVKGVKVRELGFDWDPERRKHA
ncbi:hypothetical protein VTI28DRAFT_8393 [Corynascus sepedonium]